MSYAEINSWKQTIRNKEDKIRKLEKLSQSIENTKPEFNSLINYLTIGTRTFAENRVGDFDYETELSKVGDTVKQNHELLLKVQETANNRIAELKSDIEKGKKYIKEETIKLQKAEQQRKEEAKRKQQELDKKKEKEKPLKGGPR